ncbi:MAG: complex I NDUFA9 subunit family protein [Alphaproteobacteria bacterium]|nr:complex I NDUFA9 subunit family protein [Alphaproteobacteria bacterium]
MSRIDKVATVFGGTGFLGRQIVADLAARGVRVKVATRVPEHAYSLKPYGQVGQVVPFACDYSDGASVARAIAGSDLVVNCIGILYEKGKSGRFQKIHVDLPALIAKACAENGVGRFVHVSALGCDTGTSRYAKSKLEGEKAVLANYPRAVILRPSVIFGADDDFFNMFAELARYMPALPLIGGGKTKFQPVYVGDVAAAAVQVLTDTHTGKNGPEGKIYQLGGPEVLTFREIYGRLFQFTGRQRCLVTLPYGLAKFEASFLSLLPKPLLTPDQVESLKTDNVVADGALGLEALGIAVHGLDAILPTYLERYREGGRRRVPGPGDKPLRDIR